MVALAAGFRHEGLDQSPFGIGQIGFVSQAHRGYAAAEWLGSTSRFQSRLRQPLESRLPRPLNPFRSGL